jgi:hypothetical protein
MCLRAHPSLNLQSLKRPSPKRDGETTPTNAVSISNQQLGWRKTQSFRLTPPQLGKELRQTVFKAAARHQIFTIGADLGTISSRRRPPSAFNAGPVAHVGVKIVFPLFGLEAERRAKLTAAKA